MRRLTIGEEITVLKTLRHTEVMSSGSSRAVYDCPKELLSFLRIKDDKDYVVKLAVGSGGFMQNMHETNTYMNEDEYYFAEIAVFGHFVNIMEKVKVDDFRDFAESICADDDLEADVEDYCDYQWEDADEEDKRNLLRVAETISYLAGIYGCTSDNGQLGLTKDGRYVAYDYGFIAEEGCSTQCSDELMDNILDEDEAYDNYFSKLIGILHEVDHLGLELDMIFSKVETTETLINQDYRY